MSSLSAATLASLGGTSSRRGSGDTSISVDTEASIREIKVAAISYNDLFKGYKCNCTSITVTLIFVNPPQPSLQALYSPVPDTLGSCLCSFLGATDHHVTDSPLLVSCMQAYAKIHYHITMLCVLIQDFFCLHGSCDRSGPFYFYSMQRFEYLSSFNALHRVRMGLQKVVLARPIC